MKAKQDIQLGGNVVKELMVMRKGVGSGSRLLSSSNGVEGSEDG